MSLDQGSSFLQRAKIGFAATSSTHWLVHNQMIGKYKYFAGLISHSQKIFGLNLSQPEVVRCDLF